MEPGECAIQVKALASRVGLLWSTCAERKLLTWTLSDVRQAALEG